MISAATAQIETVSENSDSCDTISLTIVEKMSK